MGAPSLNNQLKLSRFYCFFFHYKCVLHLNSVRLSICLVISRSLGTIDIALQNQLTLVIIIPFMLFIPHFIAIQFL